MLLLIISLIYEDIMNLWLGDSSLDFIDKDIMTLFVLSVIFSSLWNGATVFLSAINKHEKMSNYVIYNSALFVILSIPGVIFYKIYGILYALLFVEIVFGLIIQIHIVDVLTIKRTLVYKQYLQLFVILGLFFIIDSLINELHLKFLIGVGILLIIEFLFFDTGDIKYVKRFIKGG